MSKLGFSLYAITILLSLIGIFILYESSSYTALLHIGDKYYFIKNQIIWVFLGIVAALVVSRINYKRFFPFALPSLIFTLVLLILVFIPGLGLELKGSNRWIDLHFIVVQPSEILKITLSLYLAAWLSVSEKKKLIPFLGIFGLCVLLIAIEPDLGTALVVSSTCIAVYFLAGTKLREMGMILLLMGLAGIIFIKMEPYRVARLASFNNFDVSDLSTTSYHVKQILLALGSSGVTGVGIGNSVQKYAYLPENTTDSIFAIYAEETGFVGSIVLLSIYIIQLMIGCIIAMRVKDKFGKLLACGIITFLSVQALVNLASQVVLIPLTGVPLPFVSYGGSSMVINYISMGVMLSIARTISTKK